MSSHDPLRRWIGREGMALLTDFYQLTMLAGYVKTGAAGKRAAFEFFFRDLPPHAGFAIFAGLEQLLAGLENLTFSKADLDYLAKNSGFDKEVIDFLRAFRPELDVFAMPEGSLAFPHEPLVRVEGPLAHAQLVETFLLNALNYPTLVATKAARVCLAATGDPVLEFGLRRAQGPDGGLAGSRAAYIGGCAATSNVLAGRAFGIPVAGTHAHSWVMSHESEREAFEAYARVYPDSCLLLVDTYDTLKSGVPNAIAVFQKLREKNPSVRAAIRLDSGDLARLSKEAYKMLVAAGFDNPLIVASNDLDEDLIADLKRQGAKINSWGVGTHLITSRDFPALGGVYKLVAVEKGGAWSPKLKIAGNPEKTTDPDRKQVYRLCGPSGVPLADVLHPAGMSAPGPGAIEAVDRERFYERRVFQAEKAGPMLVKVMEKGKPVGERPPLIDVRERALASIAALPDEMKRLKNPEVFPVLLSPELAKTKEELLGVG